MAEKNNSFSSDDDSILTIENFKKAYNYNLTRLKNAEKYFENCSRADMDKWFPEYLKIINDLGIIIQALERRGVRITPEERENGFEEKK